MTRQIWKYKLTLSGAYQTIAMPTGAEFRHFDMQDPAAMWMEVDPEAQQVIRRFKIYGTGHPIADGDRWLGTTLNPPFVWHLYERDI